MHAMPWGMIAWCLAQSAVSPTSTLDQARAHLSAGKLDDVLFDLDGQTFSGADARAAAELLARAGQGSLEQDPILALQFAQMALRNDRGSALGLEVAARSSFTQKQFDPAERYADQWLEVTHHSPRARLLRAQIALDEGEWAKGLEVTQDLSAGLTSAERGQVKDLRATAERELREKTAGMSTARALQAELDAAVERVAKQLASRPRVVEVTTPRHSSGVVVYGTSWCGHCRRAREWLKAKGIPFEDKDVERDHSAAEELATKAQSAGMRLGGVPVIDVNGTLVKGFDERRIAELLR